MFLTAQREKRAAFLGCPRKPAPHHLLADSDIFESFCNDNEKDLVHLKK